MKSIKFIKTIVGMCLFLALLSMSAFTTAHLTPPPGIVGIVSVDGVPTSGLIVHIENIDTGEFQEQTTAHDTLHTTSGGYAVAIPAEDGHMIEISVFYDGYTYFDTTIVDLSLFEQWLNLSIVTGNPPAPSDDDDDASPPSGDDDDSPEEPPEDNGTEPDENDTDNDIYNLYNLTVFVSDNTTGGPVSNASVTIYDIETNMVAENHTSEEGNVTFQLEEDDYIVEVEKGDYVTNRKRVALSGSMGFTLSLKEDGIGGDNTPYISPQDVQEQGFPFIYIGLIGAVIVSIVVVLYWKQLK